MANQESGKIKQLKLRLPMQMYRQLEIDADKHGEKPATRARHILGDALMSIDVSTPEEQARIKRMIEENWQKINKAKGEE
jgi:plasmid stability protein